MKVTRSWVPGDDDPAGNWDRWALARYCYDREGQVIPAMVDALDRWPMETFEQLAGIGAEKSDLASAWQDFRHKQIQRQAEVRAATGR